MLHPNPFVAAFQIGGACLFFYCQFDGVRFLARILFNL